LDDQLVRSSAARVQVDAARHGEEAIGPVVHRQAIGVRMWLNCFEFGNDDRIKATTYLFKSIDLKTEHRQTVAQFLRFEVEINELL
jgi:hypothetical protein